jgi:hypothetical protein
MHPMFKELFIDTDADAPVAGDDRGIGVACAGPGEPGRP